MRLAFEEGNVYLTKEEYEYLTFHSELLEELDHAVMWAAVALAPYPQDDSTVEHAANEFWKYAARFIGEMQELVAS